jgi:hypothetical protein
MVEQVRRSYVVHQFDKGNTATSANKPAANGFRPGKTVNLTPVDIVTTEVAADNPPGAVVIKVDTQAETTLLNNAAFFADGHSPGVVYFRRRSPYDGYS